MIELVKTMAVVCCAPQRSDPAASRGIYDALQDVLQILSHLLRSRETASDVLRAEGSIPLLLSLLRAFIYDHANPTFGSKELQIAVALVDAIVEDQAALAQFHMEMESGSAEETISSFFAELKTILADNVKSPYTFLLLQLSRSLLVSMVRSS